MSTYVNLPRSGVTVDKDFKTNTILPNGIALGASWPPGSRSLSLTPVVPWYLTSPPDPILIDSTRQLFVDDFLIASTTMTKTYYQGTQYAGNPVLTTDKSWEQYYAMPFSHWIGRIQDGTYRAYYMSAASPFGKGMCLATSTDGVTWTKPTLAGGTNIVCDFANWDTADGANIWYDPTMSPPWTMMVSATNPGDGIYHFGVAYTSNDGISWAQLPGVTPEWGDRSSIWYNPWRKKWVFSIRELMSLPWGRIRRYWEADDIRGPYWVPTMQAAAPIWQMADSNDTLYPGSPLPQCQLYNLDVALYESVFLGLHSIFSADNGQIQAQRNKINQVFLGTSRDGWWFDRTYRQPLCYVTDNPPSPNAPWNWCNVQSVGNCVALSPDGTQIYMYSSGRRDSNNGSPIGTCGLWTFRRDGFCSMDSGVSEQTLTGRYQQITASNVTKMFVNANAAGGSLKVELQDPSGAAIPGFSKASCTGVTTDSTDVRMNWSGSPSLASLVGQRMRPVFYGTSAKLYSYRFGT